jgi:hypothetical protein
MTSNKRPSALLQEEADNEGAFTTSSEVMRRRNLSGWVRRSLYYCETSIWEVAVRVHVPLFVNGIANA